VFVALIGLAAPAVRFLYDYAWFVGFFLSAGIYYLLMRRYTPTEGRDDKSVYERG
jgi:NCS1 family nucleobase:cation symporter-1